ncbi:MAG TPA: nitrilase-related carbon-nitrogen hydrolase [Solirubrobacteraceae bacterium]|nr:nitrilase-related carbon-nitrogen hydrolase [Solirubrobacteraceae bacterium]
MSDAVRVACCQLATDVEDPAASAARTRAAIAEAIDAGAAIVVVPELSNSGYIFRSEDEARAAAIRPDDPLLQDWAAEAARGDAMVIGGFCELGADGQLYNSSALVDGEGVQAIYRKIHLWDEEERWFKPGPISPPVVETRYGRIGLAICYDIEFPELMRGLALQGADLIALPANWPRDVNPPDGRPILHSLPAVTGYLNKVFVAVCDRCGTERGVEFQGGSVIAGPAGAHRAGPVEDRGEAILYAELDLETARDKRSSERNDAFADRRPDRYAHILLEPTSSPLVEA